MNEHRPSDLVVAPKASKRILPVLNGYRQCYATMVIFELNGENIELVIGARTKKLVREVFTSLTRGHKAIDKRIYNTLWRKADE